jgi:hypothetical protein
MKKKELIEELGKAHIVIRGQKEIIDNIPSMVDRLTKLHDSQFDVAEKEIKRLNIIIHHYEDRINRIMND